MRHPIDILQAALTASLIAYSGPTVGQEPKMPEIPTEAEKVMALKLGYILNGDSMVRWGSIDLSKRALGPEGSEPDQFIGPLKPATKEERRK